MKIDRAKAPKIHPIKKIQTPNFKEVILNNGTPVYIVRDGSQELIKLDIVFEGGRHREQYRTQSKAHASLMKDGTSSKNSDEISSYIDFYGASYSTKSSLDYSTVSLFCLTKHFDKLLPVISDILHNPTFPKEEIQKFINNAQHKLNLSLAKNDIMAYRELGALIFGKDDVYGYNSSIQDFDQITQSSLLEYHSNMLNQHPCTIFIAGSFDEDLILQQLNKELSFLSQKKQTPIEYHCQNTSSEAFGRNVFPSKNKHQVSLRIGKKFGNRRHPEYTKMAFLNNVLGGFFGSRLMRNIREEKGYTYNIFSDIDCMKMDGYFYIHTELDKKHLDSCIDEIYLELDRLKQDLIPNNELEMNRNYILGNMLHGIDGPFNSIRLIKSIILNGRKVSDAEKSFNQIVDMSSTELRDLAQRYFHQEEMVEVVIGA